MTTPRIPISREKLAEFCRRWKITELSLFGSVLRDDFGPDSDVDALVTFESGVPMSLLIFARIQRELGDLLGRKVDLVLRRALTRASADPRNQRILSTAQVLYAA